MSGVVKDGRRKPQKEDGVEGTTFERVVGRMSQKLKVEKEKFNPDTKFTKDLGMDSLDIAEGIMEIEDEFDITIPDDSEAKGKIKTVADLVKVVDNIVKDKAK